MGKLIRSEDARKLYSKLEEYVPDLPPRYLREQMRLLVEDYIWLKKFYENRK